MLGKITGESGCLAVLLSGYAVPVSVRTQDPRASLRAQAAQRAGTIPWDRLWDVSHVGPSFPAFPIQSGDLAPT